jgi:hydroxymethylpyrimidine pyrophosphatase-like HAD family hydrolase
MTIRLLVFDIDGVLTDGEARALDLGLLQELAALNRRARADASQPAVTVCTGRPAPYVEVLLQAIDGHLPGVYENGAGLYVPETYRFLPHPALDGRQPMGEVRRRLTETLVHSGFAYFQPGKEHTLTLFASNPAETPLLRDEATAALGELAQELDFLYSPSCLNILPRGMQKWRGIEFLASYSGYDPAGDAGRGRLRRGRALPAERRLQRGAGQCQRGRAPRGAVRRAAPLQPGRARHPPPFSDYRLSRSRSCSGSLMV